MSCVPVRKHQQCVSVCIPSCWCWDLVAFCVPQTTTRRLGVLQIGLEMGLISYISPLWRYSASAAPLRNRAGPLLVVGSNNGRSAALVYLLPSL